MRHLIARVLGWKVVWLKDFDGELVCRLARPTPFGLRAWRMSRVLRISPVTLLDGGVVRGACYVSEWREA